jgi:hypothetical protein
MPHHPHESGDRAPRDDEALRGAGERIGADVEEQPPLGDWRRLYVIVLGELALLIALFSLFARAFR